GPVSQALIAQIAQLAAYGSEIFTVTGYLARGASRLTVVAGVLATLKLVASINAVQAMIQSLKNAGAVAQTETNRFRLPAYVPKANCGAGRTEPVAAVKDLWKWLRELVSLQWAAAVAGISNYVTSLKTAAAAEGVALTTTGLLANALKGGLATAL